METVPPTHDQVESDQRGQAVVFFLIAMLVVVLVGVAIPPIRHLLIDLFFAA